MPGDPRPPIKIPGVPGLLDLWPVDAVVTSDGVLSNYMKTRLFVRMDGVGYLIDQNGQVVLRLDDTTISPGVVSGDIIGIGHYAVAWSRYQGCNCGMGEQWSRDTAFKLGGCPPEDPCPE